MLLLHLLLCQYESICPFIGLRWIFFPSFFLLPIAHLISSTSTRSTWSTGNTPTCVWTAPPRFLSGETWWQTSRAGGLKEWMREKERESVSNYHLKKNCTTLHPFSLFHFKTVSEHAELNKGFFCSHFLSFLSCRTDIFVFLLSTRAGGLGINLTAADTVSLFAVKNQYDWNFKMLLAL